MGIAEPILKCERSVNQRSGPYCGAVRRGWVVSVNQGAGRMTVTVGNASPKVDQIVGGDPASRCRKIAD